MKKYLEIVAHYEECLERHGVDSHLSVDWPKYDDMLLRYQVMLDGVKQEGGGLLDLGCGLGGLYKYIKDNNLPYEYVGLDISEKFISACRQKHPEAEFLCGDVLEDASLIPAGIDYIIMNGVFTEKGATPFETMESYFHKMLDTAFSAVSARGGIVFNVMAKAVDWERNDLFHLSVDRLINFLVKTLSRHFVIRNDYGLYEYTTYVYKKPQRECLRE